MAEDDAPTLQRQRSGRRAAANAIDDEPSKASLAAAVSAADAALSDASSDSDSDGEMDYEARRAANIRRNQEMLAALNIPTRIAREVCGDLLGLGGRDAAAPAEVLVCVDCGIYTP